MRKLKNEGVTILNLSQPMKVPRQSQVYTPAWSSGVNTAMHFQLIYYWLVKLACFSTKLIAEFMDSASLICLGIVLSIKEKRKRENDPSSLQGWLFLSAFAFGYSSGQPPRSLLTQLQSSRERGWLSACPIWEAGSASLFPCTAFHSADGEATIWVNAIPFFCHDMFLHVCLHHGRGQSRPGGAAAPQLSKSRWAAPTRAGEPTGTVTLMYPCVPGLRDHTHCESLGWQGKTSSANTGVMFNTETIRGNEDGKAKLYSNSRRKLNYLSHQWRLAGEPLCIYQQLLNI